MKLPWSDAQSSLFVKVYSARDDIRTEMEAEKHRRAYEQSIYDAYVAFLIRAGLTSMFGLEEMSR